MLAFDCTLKEHLVSYRIVLLWLCEQSRYTRVMEDMEVLRTAAVHIPADWQDSGDHVMKTLSTAAEPLTPVSETNRPIKK